MEALAACRRPCWRWQRHAWRTTPPHGRPSRSCAATSRSSQIGMRASRSCLAASRRRRRGGGPAAGGCACRRVRMGAAACRVCCGAALRQAEAALGTGVRGRQCRRRCEPYHRGMPRRRPFHSQHVTRPSPAAPLATRRCRPALLPAVHTGKQTRRHAPAHSERCRQHFAPHKRRGRNGRPLAHARSQQRIISGRARQRRISSICRRMHSRQQHRPCGTRRRRHSRALGTHASVQQLMLIVCQSRRRGSVRRQHGRPHANMQRRRSGTRLVCGVAQQQRTAHRSAQPGGARLVRVDDRGGVVGGIC